jgi:hypothetical protein
MHLLVKSWILKAKQTELCRIFGDGFSNTSHGKLLRFVPFMVRGGRFGEFPYLVIRKQQVDFICDEKLV